MKGGEISRKEADFTTLTRGNGCCDGSEAIKTIKKNGKT
jgi:hypothetical protein